MDANNFNSSLIAEMKQKHQTFSGFSFYTVRISLGFGVLVRYDKTFKGITKRLVDIFHHCLTFIDTPKYLLIKNIMNRFTDNENNH